MPVPNLLSKTDWNSYKLIMAARVKIFRRKIYAWIKECNCCRKDVHPFDFDQTLRSHLGNAFGLEPWIMQSAGFRPSNSSSEIDGLYFVGANTQPGAGLPGVILSSRITCRLLAKDIEQQNARIVN